MNDEGRISPPAKNAVYGFLLLTLAMLVTVLLQKSSLIDGNMARRLIGFFVGILMMLVGNYLPKTRFLKALNWTSPSAATAERLAGWTLVLTGAVDVCAYMLTTLSLARALSAYLGAILVVVILLSGLFLWSKSRSAERYRNLEGEAEPKTGQQRKGLALLVALVWILVSSFVSYFWDNSSWDKSTVAEVFLIQLSLFYTTLIPLLRSSDRWKTPRCT